MRPFPVSKTSRLSSKHLLFGSLGGTLGILALFCGAVIYLVDTLTRPKKLQPFGNYNFTPFELDLPAENVVFPPRHGKHQVSGWFIPNPDAATTILVCPGYRTGKSDILGIVKTLWKDGHSVLAFEYYGHGSQVGTPVTLGYREMQDFLGAVDYVKNRQPGTYLGVVGYSMGAAITIMCSAGETAIKAIVADSAFATHSSAVDYNIRRILHLPAAPFIWLADYLLAWRAGYRFHQVEPLRDVASLSPRPILFIHGGKDSVVDPLDALKLYSMASGPKELWMVPQADHCGAYFADRPLYVKKIHDFFEEHLKRQPSRPHLLELEEAETTELNDRQAWRIVTCSAA